MRYFLSPTSCLKRLETPSIYRIDTDELYELDEESFSLLQRCSTPAGCDLEESGFLGICLQEGLLGAEPAAPKPGANASPVPSLRYLELQVTDRCNLRCRHCYIDGRGSSELGIEEVRAILDEFQEMQGLRVLITGGEPLMHSDFNGINELLPGYYLRKVLFTNGLLLTDKVLGQLYVDEIQVSIDGLEAGHEALRGKGTFDQAVGAVRRACSHGFDVSVSTMVHARNLDEFEGLQQLITDLGVREWTVDVPCASGSLDRSRDLLVSPELGGKYLEYGFSGGIHAGAPGFGCGLHLMSVSADGKAAKCTFYSSNPSGSVDEGLRTCWERVRPVRLSELACDCDSLEECRGGCRYRAELLGDPNGKDLYRCRLHGII